MENTVTVEGYAVTLYPYSLISQRRFNNLLHLHFAEHIDALAEEIGEGRAGIERAVFEFCKLSARVRDGSNLPFELASYVDGDVIDDAETLVKKCKDYVVGGHFDAKTALYVIILNTEAPQEKAATGGGKTKAPKAGKSGAKES